MSESRDSIRFFRAATNSGRSSQKTILMSSMRAHSPLDISQNIIMALGNDLIQPYLVNPNHGRTIPL
jgi:hypothetical protein